MNLNPAISRRCPAAGRASAWFGCLLLVATGAACGSGSSDPDGGVDDNDAAPAIDAAPGECVGDQRQTAKIYNGTSTPSFVPLTDGQIMAIGTFGFCTGTLIAPSWVLTAEHCDISSEDQFCIGAEPNEPNICFQVVSATNNPVGDMTIVDLGVDARITAPAVEPIPIMTELLDASWIGTTAEAAGYGEQEDGNDGEREFTAEPIAALEDNEFLTIDGGGLHGACWGDSGGPVMVVASDATVRVAGDLSWGDPSCLDEDHYARTDTSVAWIETFTGPTIVGDGPYPCGAITDEGRCMSGASVALWCDETLQSETCGDGESCGWDSGAEGYRCISGTDPCGGVDKVGICDDNTARWCEAGVAKYTDCTSCDSVCGVAMDLGGAVCEPDPCRGIDYLGACEGNVAVWCDGGELRERDCTDSDQTCQYVDDSLGYWCA